MASVELMSLSEFGAGTSSMLGQVAGMINREQTASLERVVFRATRGNAVFKSMPAPAPLLDTNAKGGGEFVDKDFFMVQPAACSMQHAACSLQPAACSLQLAALGVGGLVTVCIQPATP